MWRYGLGFALAAVLLPIESAHADYFPRYVSYPSSLNNREDTLLEPPVNDFNFEIRHLVERPPSGLLPIEGPDMEARRFHNVTHVVGNYSYTIPEFVNKDVIARENYEREHLTSVQLDKLNAARGADSADEAYRLAEGLPPIVRAYTAGAVAFHKNDYPTALSRFSEAYAFNNPDQGMKVWAAYMLGETYDELDKPDDARHLFASVRELVISGAPDPLGLGVASYGEEARLSLDEAGGVLGEADANLNKVDRRQHFLDAIKLYALQAEAGSQNGADSLHILAKDIKNVPSDFTLMMQDELARRLFLAYVRGYNGPRGGAINRSELISALLPLFPADDKDVADQLAAAAYEVVNNDLARSYIAQKPGAYSTWVEAKLALRAKDQETAALLYEKANQQNQQEVNNPTIAPKNEDMAHERAILTLAHGHYVEALSQFHDLSDPLLDETYLAERVLTIPELKDFVDRNIPESDTELAGTPSKSSEDATKRVSISLSAFVLRNSLAQRLMRTGQFHEALPYFSTRQRTAPADYVKTFDKASSASNSTSKAEALYNSATVVRKSGDNIFGETLIKLGAPDVDQTNNPYFTKGELERLAASRAESTLPHSYRRTATDLALQAASLVPARSQAFAAILCHATNWMAPVDEDVADSYYQQYVKRGAVVPWATHFGHHCPEPNFQEAKYFRLNRYWHWVQHKGAQHRAVLGGLVATAMLLIGWTVHYRRRRKQ